ncbi:hypothetical protein D9758_017895 [Tetrapyrgos nigripes]|uniref:Uncharacterized protein n=1 Tax=Tetrapyrgos nigripes TaxID=182062 RepID=A0A8H5C0J2_9AGAR|nr:hypothetical protein D9758_017895 [Tetrapyrgos nigripes]
MDSLKTGLGIPEGPGAQKVSIYFAVHEFLTLEAAESYVHHVAANTNLDSTGTTTYNGHVPLGVYHLRVKSFLSDAHYSVMGRSTIRIPSHMNPTPVYTQTVLLALEAALIKRLEVLDRSENPTRYLVMHGITWDGDAEREKVAREWVETSVTELKKTRMVRMRTFRGIDSLKMGQGVPEDPVAQKMPIYLAVYAKSAESCAKQLAGNTNNFSKFLS